MFERVLDSWRKDAGVAATKAKHGCMMLPSLTHPWDPLPSPRPYWLQGNPRTIALAGIRAWYLDHSSCTLACELFALSLLVVSLQQPLPPFLTQGDEIDWIAELDEELAQEWQFLKQRLKGDQQQGASPGPHPTPQATPDPRGCLADVDHDNSVV